MRAPLPGWAWRMHACRGASSSPPHPHARMRACRPTMQRPGIGAWRRRSHTPGRARACPLPAALRRYLWWGHAMTALALLTAWTEPFQMAFVSDSYVLK